MIIPMMANKTVLTMISTRIGTRLVYIVDIYQKEKSKAFLRNMAKSTGECLFAGIISVLTAVMAHVKDDCIIFFYI